MCVYSSKPKKLSIMLQVEYQSHFVTEIRAQQN